MNSNEYYAESRTSSEIASSQFQPCWLQSLQLNTSANTNQLTHSFIHSFINNKFNVLCATKNFKDGIQKCKVKHAMSDRKLTAVSLPKEQCLQACHERPSMAKRLQWFGRVKRKDDSDWVKWCMLMETEGTRQGRLGGIESGWIWRTLACPIRMLE